jgi:hypothetical protein
MIIAEPKQMNSGQNLMKQYQRAAREHLAYDNLQRAMYSWRYVYDRMNDSACRGGGVALAFRQFALRVDFTIYSGRS